MEGAGERQICVIKVVVSKYKFVISDIMQC